MQGSRHAISSTMRWRLWARMPGTGWSQSPRSDPICVQNVTSGAHEKFTVDFERGFCLGGLGGNAIAGAGGDTRVSPYRGAECRADRHHEIRLRQCQFHVALPGAGTGGAESLQSGSHSEKLDRLLLGN